MEKIKIAINGFGRIGRAFFKLAQSREEIEFVAINDLGDPSNLAYLLKYDSVYGRAPFDIEFIDDSGDPHFLVNGHKIQLLSEKDPKKLPWKKLEIDVVVESTGVFNKYEDASSHIKAGAKRVVMSGPGKEPGPTNKTILIGVNDNDLSTCDVTSNASCTTNATSPVVTVLEETLGIESALLNTTHAYTATQSLVDSPVKKDFRRGRAAGQNIIPSTTGAAEATTEAVVSLKGKFDGISLRVPVVVGSIADITFVSKRPTSAEEVNTILKEASMDDRWRGIFTVSDEPLVSQDIVGNTHAAIVDLELTRVVNGNLVKVLSWYDNEIGYSNTLVEHVIKAGYLARNLTEIKEGGKKRGRKSKKIL